MRRWVVAILTTGCLAGLACAPARGGWDWRAFERAHPGLGELAGERLRDAHPYLRPVSDAEEAALELFLCRWPSGASLRVSLPADAHPDERAMLDRALRAWQAAGLGLRFERSAPPADIEIRFVQEGDGSAWPRTAVTAADCRADGRGPMARSRIWLDRANLDLLGRVQPLSAEELLGAALHELGHALGFQGHGAVGPSVVVREVERVRRAGARVLAGEPLDDLTLRALYAVPQGAVVGRVPLGAERAALFASLEREARARGFRGPFVRVGDRSARFFWRNDQGREAGVVIPRWPQVVRDPEGLRLVPDRIVRRWLAEARAAAD
jgi:hypothetical protein